jgi:hypothetical protein
MLPELVLRGAGRARAGGNVGLHVGAASIEESSGGIRPGMATGDDADGRLSAEDEEDEVGVDNVLVGEDTTRPARVGRGCLQGALASAPSALIISQSAKGRWGDGKLVPSEVARVVHGLLVKAWECASASEPCPPGLPEEYEGEEDEEDASGKVECLSWEWRW